MAGIAIKPTEKVDVAVDVQQVLYSGIASVANPLLPNLGACGQGDRSDYGRQVLAANRRTGPFAVVDRVDVFEDEKGVHVSVTNPRSLLRTLLMDDQKYEALVESHLQALRGLVSGAVLGTPAGED